MVYTLTDYLFITRLMFRRTEPKHLLFVFALMRVFKLLQIFVASNWSRFFPAIFCRRAVVVGTTFFMYPLFLYNIPL